MYCGAQALPEKYAAFILGRVVDDVFAGELGFQ